MSSSKTWGRWIHDDAFAPGGGGGGAPPRRPPFRSLAPRGRSVPPTPPPALVVAAGAARGPGRLEGRGPEQRRDLLVQLGVDRAHRQSRTEA